jgi:hypothetical protein
MTCFTLIKLLVYEHLYMHFSYTTGTPVLALTGTADNHT